MTRMKLPSNLLAHAPWQNEGNAIWLASSFAVSRNFGRYKFPAKMDVHEKQTMFPLEKTVINNLSQLYHPVFMTGKEMDPLDIEFLYEHFLCLENFPKPIEEECFVVDDSGDLLIVFNSDNHLRMHFFDYLGRWEKGYERLSEIEAEIGKQIEYSFSPKFGYLTSDPFLCGTGLKASVYLHLPILAHLKQLETALGKEKEEGVVIRSMLGSLDEIVGDIVVLQNYYTLGVSEETILRLLHTSAMKMMGAEKTFRSHMKEKPPAEILDNVSRAFGLLKHSYQLGAKEALNAISWIKLGVDLGWMGGITDKEMNELIFNSRHAHLLHVIGEKNVEHSQIGHKRAHFLHEALRSVKWSIET